MTWVPGDVGPQRVLNCILSLLEAPRAFMFSAHTTDAYMHAHIHRGIHVHVRCMHAHMCACMCVPYPCFRAIYFHTGAEWSTMSPYNDCCLLTILEVGVVDCLADMCVYSGVKL